MADVPTINTGAWRLPQQAHSEPEASYTNDMYRRMGLPVDPDRASTTGGSGLPVASTEEWRLPTKEEREAAQLEEAAPRAPADALDEFTAEELRVLEGMLDESGGLSKDHNEAKSCGKSFLKRRRKGQPVGPPRAVDDDAANEDAERHEQRRLAGLELTEHLTFATGTPYRRMPVMTDEITEAGFDPLKALMSRDPQTAPKGSVSIPKSLLKKIDGWSFEVPVERIFAKARRGPIHASDIRKVIKSLHSEIKAMPVSDHKGKADFTSLLSALKKLVYGARQESVVSHEQQALAGLTEPAPLPHPMHDTRPLVTVRAHGILDAGQDRGESFVDKILQESRWFFKDFGGPGSAPPFAEAPGGRAGPWRGSGDEPAKTPIIRKGKVHGAVGKHKTPEEKGEVDVGKSEIDYDKDKGDDEEEMKAKTKGKGNQVPPKGRGKKASTEPRDSGEEEEEQREAEETRSGSHLRRLGGHLKAAGHRVSHGSAAQKAKEGLRKHLRRFAKKHGIDPKAHAAEKAKAKAKAKAKKHTPLVGPKMKSPESSGSKAGPSKKKPASKKLTAKKKPITRKKKPTVKKTVAGKKPAAKKLIVKKKPIVKEK